ncbi:MAG: NYN domain-containing protein, partial [Actinomycetota bacterium]
SGMSQPPISVRGDREPRVLRMARVAVYLDGFNLYHRRLENSPYKWLNLETLGQCLCPGDDLKQVRYFTARSVKLPYGDPNRPQRQQFYLRALETLKPRVTVHFGRFKVRKKPRHLVRDVKIVEDVYIPEEKGSDVNLGTYLLLDAANDVYDTALVISNDSDLRQPIHVVRRRFNKTVGIVPPQTRKSKTWVVLHADFEIRISDHMLHRSQFPVNMTDQDGAFHKPPAW